MSRSWLSIEGITRRYGVRTVFSDVWFGVDRGEFVVLIGHSGCGKTTILNILAGLEGPEEGVIVLDGREVSGPSLDRAVIFQSHALMPWLTALGNVGFAVRERHPDWKRSRIRDHARGVLDLVGLGDAADTSETTIGRFVIGAPDGLDSIVVGGTRVTPAQLGNLGGVPVVIDTRIGQITLTGYDAATGVVSYSYTLGSNQQNGAGSVTDPIAIAVRDRDGYTTSGTLTVLVIDDVPTARSDAASIGTAGTSRSRHHQRRRRLRAALRRGGGQGRARSPAMRSSITQRGRW